MKIIRIFGLAVCVSLIAASCEKQELITSEPTDVQEEISFEELEDTYVDVNAAVNDITRSIKGQLGGAIYNQSAVDDFVSFLLNEFNCSSSFKVSYSADMFKLLTEVALLIKYSNTDTNNYVSVDFQDNQLIYSTEGGYSLTVKFPDWKFVFTADNWPKLSKEGDSIVVELSRTASEEEPGTLIAVADYELFNEESTGNVVISFYGEGLVVSTVSFSFDKSDMLIDETTFVASYNNTEGTKGVSNTSIKITNPDVVDYAIDRMGYTKFSFEEASVIANDFNANVVDDNSLEPYAYIVGRYFRLQPVLNEETGNYEVRAAFSTVSSFEKYRLVSNRTFANLIKRIFFIDQ